MSREDLKLRQEQFRKETEIAKFESFSLMCKKVAELEKENAKLKARAIRWHDLRKNQNDLPDTDRYVCISNGKDWTKAFYSEGRWNIITLVRFVEVIAWCEIPKFKE